MRVPTNSVILEFGHSDVFRIMSPCTFANFNVSSRVPPHIFFLGKEKYKIAALKSCIPRLLSGLKFAMGTGVGDSLLSAAIKLNV